MATLTRESAGPRAVRPHLLMGSFLALALAVFSRGPSAAGAASESDLALRYGVAAFGNVDPLRDVEVIAAAGYDYIEPALSKAVALPAAELDAARRRVSAAGLHVETMNWFLPGSDIRLTGPEVDDAKSREYVERSLALAESLGAKVIVFGSPGARTVPDGFPREKAWGQLKSFLAICGEVIETRHYGMVIGIEALRKPETNIINSVAEALRLAREVNHANVRIIVDFYHLAFEHEDPDVILSARDFIVHLQIASPAQRMFPTSDDDPRYARFFTNLRTIGYHGRLSVEANAADLRTDAPKALTFLKGLATRPR
jgi:D-psicose/D-tagatose/L-ribulose 3-epimerase